MRPVMIASGRSAAAASRAWSQGPVGTQSSSVNAMSGAVASRQPRLRAVAGPRACSLRSVRSRRSAPAALALEQLGCLVRRGVVDDHDLERLGRQGLGPQPIEQSTEPVGAVVRRRHHGDGRSAHSNAPATAGSSASWRRKAATVALRPCSSVVVARQPRVPAVLETSTSTCCSSGRTARRPNSGLRLRLPHLPLDRLDDRANRGEHAGAEVDRPAVEPRRPRRLDVGARDVVRVDAVEQPLTGAELGAAALEQRRDHVRDQLRRLLARPVDERGPQDHHRRVEEAGEHPPVGARRRPGGAVRRRRHDLGSAGGRFLQQRSAEHDPAATQPGRSLEQLDRGDQVGAQGRRDGVERAVAADRAGEVDDGVRAHELDDLGRRPGLGQVAGEPAEPALVQPRRTAQGHDLVRPVREQGEDLAADQPARTGDQDARAHGQRAASSSARSSRCAARRMVSYGSPESRAMSSRVVPPSLPFSTQSSARSSAGVETAPPTVR